MLVRFRFLNIIVFSGNVELYNKLINGLFIIPAYISKLTDYRVTAMQFCKTKPKTVVNVNEGFL